MASSYPKVHIIGPNESHKATVIFIHGLGDTGEGLANNVNEIVQFKKTYPNVKFIFPTACRIPITINGGISMTGWYDIRTFDKLGKDDDTEGIKKSRNYLQDLMDMEIKGGIDPSKIILGGFSQGAAMSLNAGLTYKHKLAGIFALSGYLLEQDTIKAIIAAAGDQNKTTDIFMGHDTEDDVVKYVYGQATFKILHKDWGYQVDFKDYKGYGHTIFAEEFADWSLFVKKSLSAIETEATCITDT